MSDHSISPYEYFLANDDTSHQGTNFHLLNVSLAESKKATQEYYSSTEHCSTDDTSKGQHCNEDHLTINEENHVTSQLFVSTNCLGSPISNTKNVSHNEDGSLIQMKAVAKTDTFNVNCLNGSSKKPSVIENTLCESPEHFDLNQNDLDLMMNIQVPLPDLLSLVKRKPKFKLALKQALSRQVINITKQESKVNNRNLMYHFLRFLIRSLISMRRNLDEEKDQTELFHAKLMIQSFIGEDLPLKYLHPENSNFNEYLNHVWKALFESQDKNKSTKIVAFKLAFQPEFSLKVVKVVQNLLETAYRETLNSQISRAALIFTYWIQGSQIKSWNKEHPEDDLARMQNEARKIQSFLNMKTTQNRSIEEIWERVKAEKNIFIALRSLTMPNCPANQALKEKKPDEGLVNDDHQEGKPKKRVRE